MKRKGLFLVILFLLMTGIFCKAEDTSDKQVEILYFYALNCQACQKVKTEFLPKIKQRYGDKIRIEELDYHEPENVLRFLALQEQYNWRSAEVVTPIIVIDGKFIVGRDDINTYLALLIDTALSAEGIVPIEEKKSVDIDLDSRLKAFSPLAVISAGLIDGINPCAFTVIIFFISFLTLQGYGKRQIILVGLSFMMAVFITYVLIGIGIFRILYQLRVYSLIVKMVYIIGAIFCFCLSGLAFYDFVKFRRTGKTQGLTLQLPDRFKNKIHRIIGTYYRKDRDGVKITEKNYTFRLVVNAFVVGCLVSLFEAACTGQIYLPTLVLVFKMSYLNAFFCLMLYNIMFIVPLLIIMLFALWGVTSQEFAAFTQKHMGLIKILMMILFLGLGIFLVPGGREFLKLVFF